MSDGSNVTKSTFLAGYDEFAQSKGEMDRATSLHGALCKKLKSQGIALDELKEMYKVSRWDRDRRDSHYRNLARYAAWLEKPIGYQADLVDAAHEENQDDIEAAERHALSEAYQAGYASGKAGNGGAFNPHEPGTELHQQYSIGANLGQQLHDKIVIGRPKKEPKVPGRRRGRPRRTPPQAADPVNETVGDSSVRSHSFGAETQTAGAA